MTIFPRLSAGWLNGWLLLAVYGAVFSATVRSFPKSVIERLFDTSNWTPAQRRLTRMGKSLSALFFFLLAFSPLNVGEPIFLIGSVLFVLGLIGVVMALVNLSAAPADGPATDGLYRISRNPQWVMLVLVFAGAAIAVDSWAALLLLVAVAACYHVRILAEERSCLALYGEAYAACMEQIPRYLLIV